MSCLPSGFILARISMVSFNDRVRPICHFSPVNPFSAPYLKTSRRGMPAPLYIFSPCGHPTSSFSAIQVYLFPHSICRRFPYNRLFWSPASSSPLPLYSRFSSGFPMRAFPSQRPSLLRYSINDYLAHSCPGCSTLFRPLSSSLLLHIPPAALLQPIVQVSR